MSWPETLRAVRAWLEPWVMLWRYWRGFSGMPPPPQLKALLEWVFAALLRIGQREKPLYGRLSQEGS